MFTPVKASIKMFLIFIKYFMLSKHSKLSNKISDRVLLLNTSSDTKKFHMYFLLLIAF